ncbi:ParB N-terminal domain-containing protein [Microbacterium sp. LWH7-1.2]|uniref:ParB N-terminal domain-containing protein n=1 Tax=Microbacterium sp. LWH7-1.2 TaxID=3135257 RepID=UPI00313A2AD9
MTVSTRIGHIELERSITSIVVGNRHRHEYGDIDELAASITRDGLLQPVTVTPEGVLVCGARRLEALKRLGEKTIKVWVRSGISDRLAELLAEQAENVLHKPLTPTEAATLYTELKSYIAEDALRRQTATQFSRGDDFAGNYGGATVAPPQFKPGKSRTQAAKMVTGKASYTTLERIAELQRLVNSPTTDPELRERAHDELQLIDQGGSVTASHARIREFLDPEPPRAFEDFEAPEDFEPPDELEQLANAALARVKEAKRKGRRPKARSASVHVFPVRAFVRVWEDLDLWWTHFDVTAVATELSDEQLIQFEETLASTVAFFAALREARAQARREIA